MKPLEKPSVLGLDTAARTGYCELVYDHGACSYIIRRSGVVHFLGGRHERLRQYMQWLFNFRNSFHTDVVCFERPFARGDAATRSAWGMAGITEALASRDAAVLDVAVGTIKAWIGQTSKDTKAGSLAHAKLLLGKEPEDDNHADAICVAYYAAHNLEIERKKK